MMQHPMGQPKDSILTLVTDDDETLQERRKRYLLRAAEAKAKSEDARDPSAKQAWLRLADAWTSMANDLPPSVTDADRI